jgi:hypothetical protein
MSKEEKERLTQTSRLLALAGGVELFHSPEGDAYALVPLENHKETLPLRGKDFRSWLLREYFLVESKAPGGQALADATATLEAKAKFDGPENHVHIRVATHEGAYYVDLCNEHWRVVRVSAEGWSVEKESPVRFRRSRSMSSLPLPKQGGNLNDLFPFINVKREEDQRLLLAYMVSCLRERGPFPILVLQGEQGSAKSTTARVIRSLIDPSTASLRTMPKDEHNLLIAAKNSWLLSFDNLSGIPAWLSDALCRIATGAGFSTRELYTDADEVIFNAQRPVMANGIDELAVREDLKSRVINLYLPTISPEERRDEEGFWKTFEEAKPLILGAMLDALSGALRNLRDIDAQCLPRMADFSILGMALEKALEWPSGSFGAAYEENHAQAAEQSIENDPVAQGILEILREENPKQGTATKWLKDLNDRVEESIRRSPAWPKGPQALSNRIRRLSPALRSFGVEIHVARVGHDRSRIINMERKGK